jgi:threonine synthase
MIRQGAMIQAVICASTGDTSASLAAYCAAAGIPAIVLLPKNKISDAQLVQPLANGAHTLALDTDFDGCMEIVQQLSTDKRFYLANSINPLRIEGQKTIAVEIVQQDDWQVPDWIIVPSGNLGNITAIGLGFLMMRDLGLINTLPRLVAAQAESANPLYLSYKNGFTDFTPTQADFTQATAIQIGNPVSAPRAVPILQAFGGIVEQASEDELSQAAAMADRTGLFSCPQTGVALAAVKKLAERGVIQSNEKVIVISTATGLKFTDFKRGYHQGALPGVLPELTNQPVELQGDYKSVITAITGLIN